MTSGLDDSRQRFERIFAAIHEESPEARSRRWRGYFDSIAGPSGQIVLFGAGQFGQWTLNRVRRAGVEPCCFSDNDQTRWGSLVGGLEVLSPADAVMRFGNAATIIVTIYNGSAVRNQLRGMNCEHVVSAATLFWKYPKEFMPDLGIDTPELLVQQEMQIRGCFEVLADEPSRHELCDQLQWRYWLEPEFLPLPNHADEMYFPNDLVILNEQETLVDCGAFDGDSIRSFLHREQSFNHIYALEPDPTNRAALLEFLAQQSSVISGRVTVWPYAVSDEDGVVSFAATSDVTSKVSSSGEGLTLDCRKLDSITWRFKPTYVKMDVEGSEPLALSGGACLLRQEMPVLAVCLYHRSEHLWQIPNLVHSIEPRYSLFLRRYAEDCWEQVLYAIPPHRLAPA